MQKYSPTTIIQGPSTFYYRDSESWEDFASQWLERSLSVYHIPITEEFYDLYSDDYDLVVMDEFKRSENYSMDEYVSTGVTYEYPKEGIPIHEDEEYAGYYFV